MSKLINVIATIAFGVWLGYVVVWGARWFIHLNRAAIELSLAALFISLMVFILVIGGKSNEK